MRKDKGKDNNNGNGNGQDSEQDNDKKNSIDNIIIKKFDGEIVYDRATEQAKPGPEFKPGDTPYLQFGDEWLNWGVSWNEIIRAILKHGYSLSQLADEAQSTVFILTRVLKCDFSTLNFRTGARLLSVHSAICPEEYV